MNKYEFALQWLDFLGVKIYNKGKRMFEYDKINAYKISRPNTRIICGQDLGIENDENEENYVYSSFDDLDDMNLLIRRYTDKEHLWKPLQKVAYGIVHKRSNIFGVTKDVFKKAKLEIQKDPQNKRVRLLGDNVISELNPNSMVGPWIQYGSVSPINRKENNNINYFKVSSDSILNNPMFSRKKKSTKAEYKYINEIPLILSNEKEVICMPKNDNYCQRIIALGSTGAGKSLICNGIAGRLFWSGERVGYILDIMNQFGSISLPQNVSMFKKINALVNDQSKPLPVIHLYQLCKHKIEIHHPNVSLRLSLNFKEYLNKYQFYMKGQKEMNISSIKYLRSHYRRLKHAVEVRQIMGVLKEKFTGKQYKPMLNNIEGTLKIAFKEKFLSNLYYDDQDVTDHLEIELPTGERLSGHPFIMLMEAGVIPILNINSAQFQPWIRNYMADILQKIVRHQDERGKLRNRLWLVADEMGELIEKKTDMVSEVLENQIFRRGRYRNLGFIGNTQSLHKLAPEIYNQASYIISGQLRDTKDRKKFVDFGVDKEVYTQLGSLKKMEVMVFAGPDEPFVVYDKWGRKRIENKRKWFRGQVMPPINHHSIPNKKTKKK